MHVSICLSWWIEIFTEAFAKHPSAVSLKSNRAWLWWHAVSHSSIYKHKPQGCASINACLDFTSLQLVYFQNCLRSLNSFLAHFSTEAPRVYFQIKAKRQKELSFLVIHLNSHNGQYKEPDVRSEKHFPLTAWANIYIASAFKSVFPTWLYITWEQHCAGTRRTACQAGRCRADSHTSEAAFIWDHRRFYPVFTWANVFAECVHYSRPTPLLSWIPPRMKPKECWAQYCKLCSCPAGSDSCLFTAPSDSQAR